MGFTFRATFDARFPETGKLRTPRFVRVRDDKRVEDCTVATSFPASDPI